jgi:hypothetical protein
MLSDASTDFMLSDILYKSLVSQLGQSFITEYRSLVKEYYTLSLSLDEQVAGLEQLQKDMQIKSDAIAIQKSEREKLLELTKGQENLFQKYIDAQEQAKK